ncbi:guanine deaminase-like [Liolophura sinensis]|uniref:guanine deaminase-like n=1 Tax=Liolophura sinensis TaxID=3198878 RepID=UPI0031594ED9
MGVTGNKIVFIEDADNSDSVLEHHGIDKSTVRHLKNGQFFTPGFIDTHTHAPQYAMLGTALDKELCDWLSWYTFPTEAKFADPEFAAHIYNKAVGRLLNNGTTTVSYFGTTHLKACQILCDIIESKGQRAYVGKVNMDTNCPEYYRELTENSVEDTKRFIDSVLDRKNPLLTPVITPRFAGTCSRELLQKLGQLAQETQLPIQTHISECTTECAWVKDLFPETQNYADVYDKHNLLTPKTILAHGVYLTEAELNLIKKRKCALSHCANSNASIRSGILDVRELLNRGIKVGLGTDMSAGYSPSVLDAMRSSLLVSNVLTVRQPQGYQWLPYKEAFKLSTLGGATAMGLDDVIGNFQVGKDFDALLIDCDVTHSPFDTYPWDTMEDLVQKFIYQGDDRNITEVYVSGRRVK